MHPVGQWTGRRGQHPPVAPTRELHSDSIAGSHAIYGSARNVAPVHAGAVHEPHQEKVTSGGEFTHRSPLPEIFSTVSTASSLTRTSAAVSPNWVVQRHTSTTAPVSCPIAAMSADFTREVCSSPEDEEPITA
eukprot:359151-Amphidinium_carterae.6